jgi:hypothetical protein
MNPGNCQVFSQSLRQVIDFVHCGVEYHASFTKQSLSSTLEKSLAVTTAWYAFFLGGGGMLGVPEFRTRIIHDPE